MTPESCDFVAGKEKRQKEANRQIAKNRRFKSRWTKWPLGCKMKTAEFMSGVHGINVYVTSIFSWKGVRRNEE